MDDGSFYCEEQNDNKYGKHAVEKIYGNFHWNKAVGHVQLDWRELANKFFKFPNIRSVLLLLAKRVNRSIGLGLQIPIDYFFQGDNRVIKWLKKSVEKLEKCTDVKVEECIK